MKVIAIIKYLFTFVGIGMLAGTLFLYRNTSSFLAEATKTEGTVVDMARSRSSDSEGSTRYSYRPVVEFISKNGEVIEFVSSTGSNPPSYAKGQKVEVLYDPTKPQKARINDFFSLWGGSVILGGMGGIFFVIGTSIIFVGTLKGRQEEYLNKYGVPIETEFLRVELNTSLSVNGRHPFRVLTQWQNPSTSEVHIFQSKNLWFDPSQYIQNKRIRVLIERDNPKKYYVDLSFLPKLAK